MDDLMTRTTQIVLDPESGNGPKLKEPRRQVKNIKNFKKKFGNFQKTKIQKFVSVYIN